MAFAPPAFMAFFIGGNMMLPMKKAMTKGALLKAIATEHGLKTKACSNVLNSLVSVG